VWAQVWGTIVVASGLSSGHVNPVPRLAVRQAYILHEFAIEQAVEALEVAM
jgi:hypothetical protein